jgi:soluble lytic murein transglycosylase
MPTSETKRLLIKSTCGSAVAGFCTTNFLFFLAGSILHIITSSTPYQFIFPKQEENFVAIPYDERDQNQLSRALSLLAPHISSSERAEILRSVTSAAQLFRLDPFLIVSVMDVESSFRRGAVSPKGAQGIMQVMPTTGDYIKKSLLPKRFQNGSLFQIAHNTAVGSRYLSHLSHRFKNNWYHALAAYNWGPTRLASTLDRGGKIPAPVKGYATKVLARYQRLVESFSDT